MTTIAIVGAGKGLGLAVAVPEDPCGVGTHVRTVPADEHTERDCVAVRAAFDQGGVRQGRQGVSVAQD
ncbi:hypothetical protein IAE22_28350, partial [Bacillus sp. S34]|nr:hypothetical protein [Bacillus sp. S34]